jgi:hypothetical protein
MATSKRSASPSRPGYTSSDHGGRPPQPSPRAARQRPLPGGAALSLSALLMVGTDRVIIDGEEDDNHHFMAEFIEP